MAWTEISERNARGDYRERGGMEYRDRGSMEETIEKVRKAKKLIMEICEDLEETDPARQFGERRGYRVYEDDDIEERRGRRRY